MLSKIKRSAIFSDIDGVIWPEVPVLFEIANNIYPHKKLFHYMLTTYSVKSEKNIPQLLTYKEIQHIFDLYENIRIFKYPLDKLRQVLESQFKTKYKLDLYTYKANIEFLKENGTKGRLIFITTRDNYKNKKNMIQDTKDFLMNYHLTDNVYFTGNKISKGNIIYNNIKNNYNSEVIIIEDNILNAIQMSKYLDKRKILSYRIIIINFPWNMTKYNKKRYNTGKQDYNISEINRYINNLEKENKLIRTDKLTNLYL